MIFKQYILSIFLQNFARVNANPAIFIRKYINWILNIIFPHHQIFGMINDHNILFAKVKSFPHLSHWILNIIYGCFTNFSGLKFISQSLTQVTNLFILFFVISFFFFKFNRQFQGNLFYLAPLGKTLNFFSSSRLWIQIMNIMTSKCN